MIRLLILIPVIIILTNCTSNIPPAGPVSTAVAGDVERGSSIFRTGIDNVPPCISCHALTAGGFGLGPAMSGIAERAGERVDGLSAEDYLRQSILDPGAFIVPGYRDMMYARYVDDLSEQDIADLIGFLNGLRS